jgi:diguanylate cyclase (GGDEF)-like protein
VAVVVGDLDHFKLVNDTFGHARGDELLTAVAGALVDSVRPPGLVGRLGGEEFAVVVDDLDEDAALALVGRLAVGLRALPGLPGEVTMSFGVCVARAPAPPAAVLDRADQALYEAKRSGRDRAVLAR